MLYEKVKRATEQARLKNPGANNFYISLDDFTEFVTFHLIALTKYRNPMASTKISMNQYLQQDPAYKKAYQKKAITDKEEYNYFNSTLRNAINRFNTLNHKTAAEEGKRKQIEVESGSRATRFENAIIIHDYQAKGEMPILMNIKEVKGQENTVYQRILKNNVHNINFANYNLFTEFLVNEINNQDMTDDEKVLHHYLIEKNMKLQTIKEICNFYEDMVEVEMSRPSFVRKGLGKIAENDRHARLQLMLYVTKMPMIQQWKPYIHAVSELPSSKFSSFIVEIDSVLNFSTCILLEYFSDQEDIAYDESDMKYFRDYVNPSRFQNDYRVRKGFSSQTFTIVMKEIKKGHEQGEEVTES